jgi:alpha-tubulin suppressor-like RCC1 family protein
MVPPPKISLRQLNQLVDIVAGENHTCVRKGDMSVYCWGESDAGQAGTTVTTSPACVGTSICVNRPKLLTVWGADGTRVPFTASQIDAGARHTCAIDQNQDMNCWGQGNLTAAVGSFGNKFEPTKLNTTLKFVLVGAGGNTSCGNTSGGMYCWGEAVGKPLSPMAVGSYINFSSIAVGNRHVCGVVSTSTTTTYCWGDNQYGQIGAPPSVVFFAGYVNQSWFYPTSRVVTQEDFTCSDRTDGAVECAGLGTYGQLGNNQAGPGTQTIVPVVVGGGQQLHGVTTGSRHACALDANSEAWCWGDDTRGQLGDNVSGLSSFTPQHVLGGVRFRALAAGLSHTCGISADNHIFCWGDNTFGQLGIPGLIDWLSATPKQALDPAP